MRLLVPTLALAGFGAPIAAAAAAQQTLTEHTLTVDDGAHPASPAARLTDAAWLEGTWEGEGLGGWNQEVWTAPAAGSMMCVFRHVESDAIEFYEIAILVETESTLELRLKHFHPDLTGWEEREEVIRFPLLRRDDRTLWFDGLTFSRVSADTLRAYVAITSRGKRREAEFVYRRAGTRD